MGLYEHVAGLAVDVESLRTETRELQVGEDFRRKTTIVALEGPNHVGRGEDVTYDSALHEYPDSVGDRMAGQYTFDEFSAHLSELDLYGDTVAHEKRKATYRRWALESAALDLALKQRETNLAEALWMDYRQVRFVVSPSSEDDVLAQLRELVDRAPGIEFKLDAKPDWDDALVSELAALDRVRVVDFKSHYEEFGREPDYDLYRTVAEGFDDAVLEDAKLTPETRPAFDGHEHRLAWDKPITGVGDIEALPITPSHLNIKPSRFGTVESLLDAIEYCRTHGIEMYGGGQFELGVGRQHVQALASLFYPDAPNDVAPRVYNGPGLPERPPRSPLEPERPVDGFEWRFADPTRSKTNRRRSEHGTN